MGSFPEYFLRVTDDCPVGVGMFCLSGFFLERCFPSNISAGRKVKILSKSKSSSELCILMHYLCLDSQGHSQQNKFNDWEGRECNIFVPVLSGNGTKIAPTGARFDQPPGQMR